MKKLLFLLALSFTQLSFAQNFDIRTAPTDKNSKNIFRGVNLVTYFNLFITNVFRFHKSFNDSMKDSLLMN